VKLHDTQARFHALVTARDSVAAIAARDPAARASADEMVVGDARLSAVERLDVYAGMYFVRIHDVLAEELARTAAAMGGEAFHRLVTDYLAACPPNHPSLREAGARLPEFLAGHALAGERPWLAELARLERARLEVFDGPDAEPLTIAALSAVPPERFGALRFRLIPSHRLLANRFAISETWRADSPGDAPPRAQPETLIVWRRDVTVFHRPADDDEVRWLPRLAGAGGVVFADLCAALAETRGLVGSAARAFELSARWAAEGLLTVS
jgi:Putative DNA-binding domain